MKCSKCGVENKEGALFCKGCGSNLAKEEKRIDVNSSNVLQEMEACLTEISKMIDSLYEKFEMLKKEYNSKSDINVNEMIALKDRKEKLDKENRMLKEQTIKQQERIEELKKQLQSGIICPKCKRHYKEKVMFCSECGTRLG